MAAKFNRNTIAKQVDPQTDLYGEPSGMDKKEKSIMVRLPEEMANKYKLILAKKEIEFRDEIIYKEVITQFKDFSVKKDPNSDISENQKGEKK